MRETTPEVYLIAEPKINWDEVARYIVSVGGEEWLSRVCRSAFNDEPSNLSAIAHDAELLAEYAGRSCYRSWAPELNANVTKVREDSGVYLGNILRSKHGAVLEHAQFTFHFADVSRVFTHELVRHRAGVAISQESLRYVRLTDLGFRIPHILDDGPTIDDGPVYDGGGFRSRIPMHDAIVSLVEHLEEFQRNAAEAFGLDEEGTPFHIKKEVTSALRRLAPLGLSTNIVWSANVRTLRHVIAQRTAPGAEEEIRFVFDQVARKMQATCPLLFGDFTPYAVSPDGEFIGKWGESYDEEDGVPAWVPEYEKV
jgi:thymidylate synthase (FAD)